jgi:hypothetical protein
MRILGAIGIITSHKFGRGYWCSVAVQFVSEPEICHGAGFKLTAGAGVRVQELLQIFLESRSKSKKFDKLITPTVHVKWS